MTDGRVKKNKKKIEVVRKTEIERFIEKIKVDKTLGCWMWKGSVNSSSTIQYGQFVKANGLHIAAHRFSYEYFREKIPKNKYACHRCDKPLCVNPFHIFIGTQQDNINDMWNKGRAHPGGALHPNCRLTEEIVIEARRLRKNGFSITALIRKYNVSSKTIRNALIGKTWRHVKNPKLKIRIRL